MWQGTILAKNKQTCLWISTFLSSRKSLDSYYPNLGLTSEEMSLEGGQQLLILVTEINDLLGESDFCRFW